MFIRICMYIFMYMGVKVEIPYECEANRMRACHARLKYFARVLLAFCPQNPQNISTETRNLCETTLCWSQVSG